ncbi:MAG: hypothetical protein ACPG77_04085 [Nannocystaceae bacterium]
MHRHPTGASPWLRSSHFDLTLIVGVFTLALVLGGVATTSPAMFASVLLLDFWLLAYPHVASTFTRIACDRHSIRRHWFLLFGLPPLVLAGTAGLTLGAGVIALNTLYFVWQSWHYSRQSYGIARAYHRAAGSPYGPDALSSIVVYTFPLWGLLHRSAQGNHEFYGMPLHLPQVPVAVEVLAGAIAWTSLAIWLGRALQTSHSRVRATGHTLFVLSHVGITTVSYVLIDEITSGWLFINIWHNAQYILFVWAANTRRFAGGLDPKRRFISRLCQPKNLLAYALFCGLAGGLFYTGLGAVLGRSAWDVLPLVLVGHMTVNFHHYLIDAVIWRRPKARPSSRSDVLAGVSR